MDAPHLEWSAAEVRDGTLTVRIEGDRPRGWKSTFDHTVRLLGGGDWGEVSLKKAKVKVTDVPEGDGGGVALLPRERRPAGQRDARAERGRRRGRAATRGDEPTEARRRRRSHDVPFPGRLGRPDGHHIRDEARDSPGPPATLGLLGRGASSHPPGTRLQLRGRRRRPGRATPTRCSSASRSWPSRPRGRRCGSAPTRSATSRPPASMRRGASSTCITRAGARTARPQEVRPHGGLRPRAPGAAPARPAHSALQRRRRASTRRESWPARSVCSTWACSGSAPRSTPTTTVASAWPPCSSRASPSADGELVFDYLAKGGVRRVQAVQDPPVIEVVQALKRRRGGGDQLLAYKEGRRWHDVRSEQINDYLKSLAGDAYSAKDFRTWNATVLAAVSLAADGREAKSATARKRAINGAVRGVAEVLGNTPGGGAPLLHRPPRIRPLSLRLDDRRRGGPARRPARARRPAARTTGARRARRSWTMTTTPRRSSASPAKLKLA